jgi:cytochrome c oxidase subunit 2
MLLTILADGANSSPWLPQSASEIAPKIDSLFNFVLFINVFFVALVTVILVVLVIKYRHREGHTDHTTTAGHSTALELTWTIIPLIIVMIIYLIGFHGYMRMAVPPENAYEIIATGHMWNWSFTYPNGHVDPDLHVPRGVPVKITLQSQDVIHSLFLPEFRVKKDVVPGRWNQMWFTATEDTTPGAPFDVFCAAYCGTEHSQMRAKCYVHEPADFDKWLKDASIWVGKIPPAEEGQKLYKDMGCISCHSVDGTRIIGPSWKDLFGSEQAQDDGTSVKVTDNYVLNVAWDPGHTLHLAGYQMVMPSFRGQLSQEDVGAIIGYMKTISKYVPQSEKDAMLQVSKPTTVPATQGALSTPGTKLVPPPGSGLQTQPTPPQ